jgi:hypothetical protein
MRVQKLRARRLRAAIAVVGLLGSGLVVWQSSQAAFTATTSNPSNSWAAGTVSLTDDDGGNSPTTGTAMFSTAVATANLKPGDTGTKCIAVTYGGSFTSVPAVKLYVTNPSGTGLGTYLDFTVEEGTNGQGDFAGCGTFAGSFLYKSGTPVGSTGTLAYLTSNMTDYSNGVGTWTPTATGQTKAYRFTYTVQNNDLAQGKNVTVSLVWEARSS